MEITNRGVNNAPVTPQPPVEPAAASPGQGVSGIAANASAYVPSPELTRLLDQVRAQPEVRADRVQAAIERLQQGYYQSPSAIEQTAQALLDSGD